MTDPAQRPRPSDDEFDDLAPPAGRGRAFIVLGGVLAAIGVVGIAFFFGRPAPDDEAAAFAAWNTTIIIGSAVALGTGLMVLLLAFNRRRARSRRGGGGHSPSSTA